MIAYTVPSTDCIASPCNDYNSCIWSWTSSTWANRVFAAAYRHDRLQKRRKRDFGRL